MSDETERALRNWEPNSKIALEEILHEHLQSLDQWDWCDISDEGNRAWEMALKIPVEEWSPIDGILSAVAAQASHGAFAAVAAALGVDARALENAIAPWYENQRDLPPPVGIAGLGEEISASEEYLRSPD